MECSVLSGAVVSIASRAWGAFSTRVSLLLPLYSGGHLKPGSMSGNVCRKLLGLIAGVPRKPGGRQMVANKSSVPYLVIPK